MITVVQMELAGRLYAFFVKAVLSAVLILSLPLAPLASQHEDIKALMLAGDWSEALSLTNDRLSSSPNNYALLFTKATILGKSGAVQSAIEIYKKLVRRYPDVPELFNNLAVHYANNGQFDLAVQTLEKALKTHSSYAVSYTSV